MGGGFSACGGGAPIYVPLESASRIIFTGGVILCQEALSKYIHLNIWTFYRGFTELVVGC